MTRPKLVEADNFPEKFSLAAYDACASWEMKKWFVALKYRNWLFDQIKFYKSAPEIQKLVNQLIANPLKNDLPLLNLSLTPVQDQTIAEFFSCYSFCDKSEQGKKYTSWHNALEKEDRSVADLNNPDTMDASSELNAYELIELQTFPAWKVHKTIRQREIQPFNDRYFISIDLKSSDEQLEKAFKSWVKKIRNEIKAPERIKITQEMLCDWHNKRYLPVIDVWLWSLFFGNVTYAKYGKMIYGDNQDSNIADPENIRKTILKNATHLVSYEFVNALERLVKHPDILQARNPKS